MKADQPTALQWLVGWGNRRESDARLRNELQCLRIAKKVEHKRTFEGPFFLRSFFRFLRCCSCCADGAPTRIHKPSLAIHLQPKSCKSGPQAYSSRFRASLTGWICSRLLQCAGWCCEGVRRVKEYGGVCQGVCVCVCVCMYVCM